VTTRPSAGAYGPLPASAPDGPDTADRLSAVLDRLVRLLRRQAPAEVGPGSLAALATLRRAGPLRLGDLAVREAVAPPTLTRMIAVLEEAGHVVRRTDEHDRRAVLVSVTPAGARVVDVALAARAVVVRARLAALDGAALAALHAAVPALEALADDTEGPAADESRRPS